jgi:alkylhydroperoxidase/carboxymuconolactone decarboxylase family protein YurZ
MGINGVVPVPLRAKNVVGRHAVMTLAGPHMVDNLERLEAMNPSLGRHVLENDFGCTTPNSGMAYREWALPTMGVLTAIGDCADQLDVYTEAAQLHGATEAEIVAVINHASSFGVSM